MDTGRLHINSGDSDIFTYGVYFYDLVNQHTNELAGI